MRVAQALDMLRDELPNTFVNFVPLIDITITLVFIIIVWSDKCGGVRFQYSGHVWQTSILSHRSSLGLSLSLWRVWRDSTDPGADVRPPARIYGGGQLPHRQREVRERRLHRRHPASLHQPEPVHRTKVTVNWSHQTTSKLILYRSSTRPGRRPRTDYSFFAPDCLHPSQKLHALMARALWNNMLSPRGRKATSWSSEPPLLCPTEDQPYLKTRLNSQENNMNSTTTDYVNYMNTVMQYNIGCYM